MPVNFRGGWLPTPANRPRVRMDAALRTAVAPVTVDYHEMPVIGMHLNDEWGDCTVGSDANAIQLFTYYGQGLEIQVPDSDCLTAYEASGFDPAQGGPGQNPTDNGWTVADAFSYLQHYGMAGHKIALYGQVPADDSAKMQTAIWEFGCLSVGVNLPNIAMTQFNASSAPVWDVVADDGGIAGGHCVLFAGYDSGFWYAYTWNAVVRITPAWWAKYGIEAWAPVSADWVSTASGKDPAGVDKYVLGQEFADVTGGANPFPAPAPPPPVPVVPPVPDPVPVVPPAPIPPVPVVPPEPVPVVPPPDPAPPHRRRHKHDHWWWWIVS
jgi:hypothetical protein